MTLGEELLRLFPDGTTAKRSRGRTTLRDISALPAVPTDLFGGMAYLVEKTGAYHRLLPVRDSQFPGLAAVLRDAREMGRGWAANSRKLRSTASGQKNRAKIAWRKIVNDAQAHWDVILASADMPLLQRAQDPIPTWWTHAIALMVFADEACVDVGYRSASSPNKSFIDEMVYAQRSSSPEFRDKPIACTNSALTHKHYAEALSSYGFQINKQIVRVLPKGRTPSVGCTIRSLSHNLSIIADPASLEMGWFTQDAAPSPDTDSLKVLLVPLPYDISATAFQPTHTHVQKDDRSWGAFKVNQAWLRTGPSAVKLLEKLLIQAEEDSGAVNAIVFPELSLDWKSYREVVEFIIGIWNPRCDEKNAVQFLVAGLSENYLEEHGNFAYVTTFQRIGARGDWEAHSWGRRKHHRWKLTPAQLTDYALSATLEPSLDWWEDISIDRRSLAVHVVREKLSISALICEDLARSDPCHTPLRALGPNLIIALLMDGPQLPERWPGRYATTLADDPGSSVLTMTSAALLERNNRNGRHAENRVVALWKDDRGATVPLQLPRGASGILVSLSLTPATEFTLDGRLNGDAVALHYQCHQPITVR